MSNHEQNLFRQQVIDEFNSKLNGEVIINSDFSVRFIAIIFVWLVLGAIIISSVKINLSKKVTGILSYDKNNTLIANFSISPDLINDFYAEKIIDVELHNISSKSRVYIPLKIAEIDNKLVTNESQITLVKVTTVVQESQVRIEQKEFKLTEGIEFSFSMHNEKISLITWIKKRYFSGEKYGY